MTYVKDNFAHLRVVTGGDPAGAGLLLVSSGAGVGAWSGSPSITALTLSGALTAASAALGSGTVAGNLTIGSVGTGRLLLANSGSAAAPAFGFSSAEGGGNDGFYESGSHNFAITVAGNQVMRWTDTSAVIVTGSGTYTGTWTQASDRRLKKAIEPVLGALDQIMALRPITYLHSDIHEEWLGSKDDRRRHGLIAQDVQGVLPDLVDSFSGDDEHPHPDLLSVDYSRLVVPLIAAVQDLAADVRALRSEVLG